MLDRLADALEESVGVDTLLQVIDSKPIHGRPPERVALAPWGGTTRPVTVVGIGADWYDGLAPALRAAIDAAGVVLGGKRQLDLLPESVRADRIAWPSPLRPAIRESVAEKQFPVHGSCSPLATRCTTGIGRTLIEELGADWLHVLPHPSSVTLACARMGWPVESTPVVSTLTGPVEAVLRHVGDGARILVLSRDGDTPRHVAGLLHAQGFGASLLTVLGNGGAAEELRIDVSADESCGKFDIAESQRARRPLHRPSWPVRDRWPAGATRTTTTASSPSARCARSPSPRWRPAARSAAVGRGRRVGERRRRVAAHAPVLPGGRGRARPERAAASHGTPRPRRAGSARRSGPAPEALADCRPRTPIFIGGGVTAAGVLEACWAALRPGGRLVANAVTLESRGGGTAVASEYGGDLVQLEVAPAPRWAASPAGGRRCRSPSGRSSSQRRS